MTDALQPLDRKIFGNLKQWAETRVIRRHGGRATTMQSLQAMIDVWKVIGDQEIIKSWKSLGDDENFLSEMSSRTSTTKLSDRPQGGPITAHDRQYYQSSDSKQSRPTPYPDICTFNFIHSIPEGEKVR
jgi:hypothetical protein